MTYPFLALGVTGFSNGRQVGEREQRTIAVATGQEGSSFSKGISMLIISSVPT